MWDGKFPNTATPRMRPSYERLAQAILRLGTRFSSKFPGKKISVWFVIPQVPYVMCGPIKDPMVALWEAVEGVVSFGFQMTETESQNVDRRGDPTPGLRP
jgi:hypothetical protein